MSQLSLEQRHPQPSKNLVQSLPVKGGKKLQKIIKCIICSSPKTAYIMNQNNEPLVLRCIKCGHKSWYSIASCA